MFWPKIAPPAERPVTLVERLVADITDQIMVLNRTISSINHTIAEERARNIVQHLLLVYDIKERK